MFKVNINKIDPFKYSIWAGIFLFGLVTQLIPAELTVVVAAVISLFLFRNNKKEALCIAFIGVFCSGDVTFGGIIAISGILTYFALNCNITKINKGAFFCICLILFYQIVTIIDFFFTANVDDLYFAYLIQNTYKYAVMPFLMIMLFSFSGKNGLDYLKLMFTASICLTVGQIAAVTLGEDVYFYSGFQFHLSFLLLVISRNLVIKLVSLLNVTVYMYLFIKGHLYFSSQDVMLILISLSLYIYIYKKTTFAIITLSSLFISLFITNIQAPNAFLQNTFGLEPSVSFKLTQFFDVFLITNFADIPWSPRVRIIEFINAFDRNPVELIFGSGNASYITESIMLFSQSGGGLSPSDFSLDEISRGVFYGLHNFPRGFLHYGLIYFLISGILFYRNVQHFKKESLNCHETQMANVFLVSMACWNPSILFLFLQLSLSSIKKKNDEKSKKNIFLFI